MKRKKHNEKRERRWNERLIKYEEINELYGISHCLQQGENVCACAIITKGDRMNNMLLINICESQ